MKCEVCRSREATVRYAEVVDGSVTTLHLCQECASERGVGASLSSFAGPLVKMLMGLLEGGGEVAPPESGPTCPKCGMTYEQFRRAGRLGCAGCYEAFSDQLKPLLRRIHGSTVHAGRVPSNIEGDYLRRMEVRKLRKELARAVHDEDYERAAELRDEIREREREFESAEAADVDV